ncbi:MAG: hypothetical protein NWF10_08105 [Candidatus Bathyarchaeota archaeon]|jgi:hypothetical protein|nr:hypothetical protein [Candidatus Bathyarchaeota archaeon]
MSKHKIAKNKTRAIILTFLIATTFAPIALAFAGTEPNTGNEQPQGIGNILEVPGLPDNVIQYNKTDITPVAQMEKVLSGEPALFCYENTTMLFNSTMNCELIITAEPTANQKIFALSIEPNQTMTLTMNLSSAPLQGELVREKNLNFYASIEPNATIQLKAQLRLYINQTELSQELNWEVNASKLTWMYWNGTKNEWVQVPSHIDQNGYLVCNTDHFSLWTIGEVADPVEQTQAIVDMAFIYGGIGVGIIILVALGIVVYSKRS